MPTNYKTQQQCFDSADAIGDTFFYGIPNKGTGYEYNHCKDVKAFRKIQYDNKEDHYYNEMIREGQPCIEYYDFDDKAGDKDDIDGFIKRFIQLRISLKFQLRGIRYVFMRRAVVLKTSSHYTY